jgi:hypothetical protein
MRRDTLGALAFCITLAFAASMSWAGYGGGGGIGRRGGGQSYTPPAPAPPPPPPIDRSASTKARQEVQSATMEVERANAALAAVTAQLHRAKLEPTSAWKTAAEAVAAAQKQYDAAREAVMATLKSDPAYQGALAARAKAQADHNAMDASTPIEERYRIANAMVSTPQVIAALETGAIMNNPAAAKAKAALDAANAAEAALQTAFDQTLANDPTWSAAAKSIEERKQRLAEVKKSLSDALAQEAQMARDRQKQIASNH